MHGVGMFRLTINVLIARACAVVILISLWLPAWVPFKHSGPFRDSSFPVTNDK